MSPLSPLNKGPVLTSSCKPQKRQRQKGKATFRSHIRLFALPFTTTTVRTRSYQEMEIEAGVALLVLFISRTVTDPCLSLKLQPTPRQEKLFFLPLAHATYALKGGAFQVRMHYAGGLCSERTFWVSSPLCKVELSVIIWPVLRVASIRPDGNYLGDLAEQKVLGSTFPCGLFITADECFFHSITWYYGQPVSHNPGSNIPVVNQPCYKHGNDPVGLILESDHAGGKDPISIADRAFYL
jgi:hypothetical protein